MAHTALKVAELTVPYRVCSTHFVVVMTLILPGLCVLQVRYHVVEGFFKGYNGLGAPYTIVMRERNATSTMVVMGNVTIFNAMPFSSTVPTRVRKSQVRRGRGALGILALPWARPVHALYQLCKRSPEVQVSYNRTMHHYASQHVHVQVPRVECLETS